MTSALESQLAAAPSEFDRLLRVMDSLPNTNVLESVDALLQTCAEDGLCVEIGPDETKMSVLGLAREWRRTISARRILRSLLARVAEVMKSAGAGTVSPYGGRGELAIGGTTLAIEFTNTADAQLLRLTPGSAARP